MLLLGCYYLMKIIEFDYNKKKNIAVGISAIAAFIGLAIEYSRNNFIFYSIILTYGIPYFVLIPFLFVKKTRVLFILSEVSAFLISLVCITDLYNIIRVLSYSLPYMEIVYSLFLIIYYVLLIVLLVKYHFEIGTLRGFVIIFVGMIIVSVMLNLAKLGIVNLEDYNNFGLVALSTVIFYLRYFPYFIIFSQRKVILGVKRRVERKMDDNMKTVVSQSAVFCTECGNRLVGVGRFCPFCGKELDSDNNFVPVMRTAPVNLSERIKKQKILVAMVLCSVVIVFSMFTLPVCKFNVVCSTSFFNNNDLDEVHYLVLGEKTVVKHSQAIGEQINSLSGFIIIFSILLIGLALVFVYMKKYRSSIISSLLFAVMFGISFGKLSNIGNTGDFSDYGATYKVCDVTFMDGFYIIIVLAVALIVMSFVKYLKQTELLVQLQ